MTQVQNNAKTQKTQKNYTNEEFFTKSKKQKKRETEILTNVPLLTF